MMRKQGVFIEMGNEVKKMLFSFCRDVEGCLGCEVITPEDGYNLAFTPFD